MSIFSRLAEKRKRRSEQRRDEAVAKAMARGATPEQAKAAGERAVRRASDGAILGAINS
jgi:hypothetical protein